MSKPFVAIGNLASDVTPCNVHLTRLADKVKEGVWAANAVPFMFGTITVSDGISMGTEGMKASLVSREVIADSIETVTMAEGMDGLLVVAACDKNMPGAMMAMARLNVPAIFVYGGAIMPGNWQGKDVNIQDVFEAVGAWSQGNMSLDDLDRAGVRRLPRRGRVRRHVHREHDVLGDRGDGHVRAGRGLDTGDRPAQRDGRVRGRRDAVQAAGARHPATGHHHAQLHGERDHGRAGDGPARRTRCSTCWPSRGRRRWT